jgi:hypothetical protein
VHADYRPISITPILTRLVDKTVVPRFLCHALHAPHLALSFSDQFAFRPTAVFIAILPRITRVLFTEPVFIVMATDFSKALDRVRHFFFILMEKMAG